ncbi:MAG TPA: hypothetical protein VMZ53_11610 [Kofleriaceae bacterium]|nr:hypothetical protein [Kofleriaceae bacterium]
MRFIALGCLLAGCGRVGFESSRVAQSDATSSSPLDAITDTLAPLSVCPFSANAPDPLTVSGITFQYTGPSNMTGATPSILVTASRGGTQIAQTTSDAAGDYTLVIPTGGASTPIEIDYGPSGYWTTQVIRNVALDTNVTGPNTMFWRIGDGPIWGDGQMGAVYAAASLTYDLAKATLQIAARDCAGAPIGGVTVTVEPPPEKLLYINSNGDVDGSLTTSDAMYGHAVGFNAVAGPTHITASKDGVSIYEMDVDVQAGRYNVYPVFYIP